MRASRGDLLTGRQRFVAQKCWLMFLSDFCLQYGIEHSITRGVHLFAVTRDGEWSSGVVCVLGGWIGTRGVWGHYLASCQVIASAMIPGVMSGHCSCEEDGLACRTDSTTGFPSARGFRERFLTQNRMKLSQDSDIGRCRLLSADTVYLRDLAAPVGL